MMDLAKSDELPKINATMRIWNSVGDKEIPLDPDVMNEFGKCTSRFYHNVYNHLLNGEELMIRPEHIVHQIAIFQEMERQNPLAVKYTAADSQ